MHNVEDMQGQKLMAEGFKMEEQFYLKYFMYYLFTKSFSLPLTFKLIGCMIINYSKRKNIISLPFMRFIIHV